MGLERSASVPIKLYMVMQTLCERLYSVGYLLSNKKELRPN